MNVFRYLTETAERRVTLALLFFLALLYIPFAGNYGLWDPWETHYSEVARQMVMRHDYVSLWWPGSPQDRNEFWSKPVLTFWLMALGFLTAGLERAGHAFDGEMAVGWTAEWAVRIPFILCGIACVWAVWELTRRLAGRRAGLWAAIVLATSSQFLYVTRQAMTDMAFVAPIALAIVLAGLALIGPQEEMEQALPRRRWGPLSWPATPSFYALIVMLCLVAVPELVACSIGTRLSFRVGRWMLYAPGAVCMSGWMACLAAFLYFALRATCRRQIYLHIAFFMGAVSTLAKGPAGIGLPVIVILLHLVLQGDWRRLLPSAEGLEQHHGLGRWLRLGGRFVGKHPLEFGLGVLVFGAIAAPWYHAMVIRHGMGFWNEFIGDNYVHRAAGRHGDRGTFDYYILQIGQGMFPWIGFVGAGLVAALGKLRGDDSRTRLRGLAIVWFLTTFAVMSLVNTKFHHYILPALPALAILAGLYIDELFSAPKVANALGLLLCGVPLVALAGRDLALFPARLLWLFCYDYVNAPNGGRPWPPGEAYDYRSRIAVFAVVATLATSAVALVALRRARANARGDGDEMTPLSPRAAWALGAFPIVTVLVAQLWQPAFGTGPAPLANGWILVGAATSLFLVVVFRPGLRDVALRPATLSLLGAAGFACFWSAFAVDRLLTDVSPHWSQKHVIAAYYQQRQSSDEPLIAWQMYWRGENFYTKNAIYDHRVPQGDKTVFLGDRNAEKLQQYFASHPGRRVFFIVERSRFEALRALLPEAARPTLRAVDDSNNKVYLAVAQI